MATVECHASTVDVLKQADPLGLYADALASYPYMMCAEDVAEFVGQTPQAVTKHLRLKAMPGVKVGNSWRVPKKLFIEYLYANLNNERVRPEAEGVHCLG